MTDHDAARRGDFACFIKRTQKTNGVNKIANGIPRDGWIVRRVDASLRQIRIGEFEIRQEDVDDFRLFAEHFDARISRAVPNERKLWGVLTDGFAQLLDVRPPMFRRHKIQIVDAFCD